MEEALVTSSLVATCMTECREQTMDEEKKPQPDNKEQSPYLRAENEDDDGYDPFSDRPPEREPLFERDPWG